MRVCTKANAVEYTRQIPYTESTTNFRGQHVQEQMSILVPDRLQYNIKTKIELLTVTKPIHNNNRLWTKYT